MKNKGYICPKCGCTEFDSERIQTTGGNFSKVFDVQNKRFTAIICTRCGYTEFYRENSSLGWNIIDLATELWKQSTVFFFLFTDREHLNALGSVS